MYDVMSKESDVVGSSGGLRWPWYRRMYESGLDACERRGFRFRSDFALSAFSQTMYGTKNDERSWQKHEIQQRHRLLKLILAASNHRGKRAAHVWMTSADVLLVQEEVHASIINGTALILLQPVTSAYETSDVGKISDNENVFQAQLRRILFDPWKESQCPLQRIDIIFAHTNSFWNDVQRGLISKSFGGPLFSKALVHIVKLSHRMEHAEVIRKDIFARCEQKKMTYVLTIQNDRKLAESRLDIGNLRRGHIDCPCLLIGKREEKHFMKEQVIETEEQTRHQLLISMRKAAKGKEDSMMQVKPKEVLLIQCEVEAKILERSAIILLPRKTMPSLACASTEEEHTAHMEYIIFRACRQLPFEMKRIDILFANDNSIEQIGKCYKIVQDANLWYSDRVTKVVLLEDDEERADKERERIFELGRTQGFTFRILVSEE